MVIGEGARGYQFEADFLSVEPVQKSGSSDGQHMAGAADASEEEVEVQKSGEAGRVQTVARYLVQWL